jgi:S1-C subfamily serine protease
MTRVRVACAIALSLIAGLGLVACGEDSDGETETTTATTGEESGSSSGGDSNGFDAQEVYDRAAPGVVTITSVFNGNSNDLLGGGGPAAGQGTGFVISKEGEIVTNAHVVTDGEVNGSPDVNQAQEVYIQFPDLNSVEAKVVGFDAFADVALLKVDPDGLDLEPLELGDIEDVDIGEPVATLGSPFGASQSLSVGIVSQTGRSIPSLTEFTIDGAIQTDASINPGNSGGPLLDSAARVVGVNQQIPSTTGTNQGVGFAIPVDLASRSVDQLRENGKVEYAYVGVGTRPLFPQLADELEIDAEAGAIIERVEPNSPADEAGLRGGDQEIEFQALPYEVGGDIIVAVDGKEVVQGTDLSAIVTRLNPGDTVTFEVIRDGERVDVDVKLANRPITSPDSP